MEEIKIVAGKKGFDLEAVEVSIEDPEGRVIETGKAEKVVGNNWIFKALLEITNKDSIKVIVRTKTKYGAVIEKQILFESRS